MARRKRTTKCPVCKVELKADRLQVHIDRVHGGDVEKNAKPRKSKDSRVEVFAAIAVVLTLLVAGLAYYWVYSHKSGEENNENENPPPSSGIHPTAYTRIETSRGVIIAELYGNETPITVNNFESLARRTFFDGTIFHRVIKDFMIQGGGFLPDLTQKDTSLTPIKLETHPKLTNVRGTLAMARTTDPNSATSQFFINHKDNPSLDHSSTQDGYAVFGKVISGMDVVDTIANVPTSTRNGMADVPNDPPVLINRIVIMSTPQG
jgi:cyclophilin family peptidyl-prolyl cis-trans isomerase